MSAFETWWSWLSTRLMLWSHRRTVRSIRERLLIESELMADVDCLEEAHARLIDARFELKAALKIIEAKQTQARLNAFRRTS